jgi:hypothetical protein
MFINPTRVSAATEPSSADQAVVRPLALGVSCVCAASDGAVARFSARETSLAVHLRQEFIGVLTAHFLCDATSTVVTQTGRILLQIEVILSSKSAGIWENRRRSIAPGESYCIVGQRACQGTSSYASEPTGW